MRAAGWLGRRQSANVEPTGIAAPVWGMMRLRPEFDHPGSPDPWLLWPVLLLTAWGLVMVYSASIAVAAQAGNPMGFLIRQLVYALIGVVVAWWVYRLPTAWWQRNAKWVFLAAVLLLVLVLVPGIGKSVNGARRWIGVGQFNIQPAEVMKLAMAIFAADYTVRKFAVMKSVVHGFLPLASIVIGIGVLLLLQPDFGSLVVISAVAFGILFLGGLDWRIFAALFVTASVAFAAMILVSPYRMARLVAFLDPWSDPLGKGYQLTHALIALGRGGWFGVGLGGSIEKLFYLPEAHTDFILAVIGEELGWVGVAGVVLLFGVLLWRIFQVGRRLVQVEAYFAGLAVLGVGLAIGMQAAINMGVNVGLLPTKGLTLPFMSYGGSALVMSLVAVAFVMRAEWELRALCPMPRPR